MAPQGGIFVARKFHCGDFGLGGIESVCARALSLSLSLSLSHHLVTIRVLSHPEGPT